MVILERCVVVVQIAFRMSMARHTAEPTINKVQETEVLAGCS